MARYRNINLNAKKEKGNRRPVRKDNNVILKTINNNRAKISEVLHAFQALNKMKGEKIFILKYVNEIPPASSRIIFGSTPINLKDVKQKSIKTFQQGGAFITHLYYSISDEIYNNFIQDLETILSWVDIRDMPKSNIKDEILNLPNKLLLINQVLAEYAPKKIEVPKAVRIIYVYKIIEELFSNNVLSNENFDRVSNVAFLNEKQYKKLYNIYPGIIVDVSSNEEYQIPQININDFNMPKITLPTKFHDAIVGVIDAGCNLPSQFDPFIVSNKDMREYNGSHNYDHGSFVSSLIIANDELNPKDKDNLGNFKIMHFELLQNKTNPTSYWHITDSIKKIIEANSNVKVWNLSMNAIKTPYSSNVSPLGILLDKLAHDNEVLFIVSSGNYRDRVGDWKQSLGSPADALNVLSVGSVKPDAVNIVHPEDYSSFGPILHFEKPEVSHYGGPYNKSGSSIGVHSSSGIIFGQKGTSFSAPRVTRLAAYYIDNGFTPFEAKAKIISMATPEKRNRRKNRLGWKSAAYGHLTDINKNAIDLKMTLELSNIKPQYFPIEIVDGIEEIIITSTTRVLPKPWLGEEYSNSNIELSLIWYDDLKNPEYHLKALNVEKDIITDDKKYGAELIKRFDGGKWFSTTKVASSIKAINNKRNTFIVEKNIDNPQLAIRIRKQDLFRTVEDQKESVSVVVSLRGNFNIDLFERVNNILIEQDIGIDV